MSMDTLSHPVELDRQVESIDPKSCKALGATAFEALATFEIESEGEGGTGSIDTVEALDRTITRLPDGQTVPDD